MATPITIVTGAGGALGQATVRALVAEGHRVVGVDRDPGSLQPIREVAGIETADLTDRDAVSELFERLAGDLGPPDVVVNTVGGFRPGSLFDTTPETLSFMMDLNLTAALWISQAAAGQMAGRGGSIVNVAARHGLEPTAGAVAYSLSKAALVHMTRVLDLELRHENIRLNAIVPRLLDTPANRGAIPADVLDRATKPEQLAAVIAFLVSEAGSEIRGAVVPVYGSA